MKRPLTTRQLTDKVEQSYALISAMAARLDREIRQNAEHTRRIVRLEKGHAIFDETEILTPASPSLSDLAGTFTSAYQRTRSQREAIRAVLKVCGLEPRG